MCIYDKDQIFATKTTLNVKLFFKSCIEKFFTILCCFHHFKSNIEDKASKEKVADGKDVQLTVNRNEQRKMTQSKCGLQC